MPSARLSRAAQTEPCPSAADALSEAQISERQREANRLHKSLEDTGIKLDCVATDILGKSGRPMLEALVAGTTDPEVLADLAKGRMRTKIPALREALEGGFEPLLALLIGATLAHLDSTSSLIGSLLTSFGWPGHENGVVRPAGRRATRSSRRVHLARRPA
jgi:hypothetical protein